MASLRVFSDKLDIQKKLDHEVICVYVCVLCVEMYFVWVTASQKQFEWLLDILRNVEEVDEKEIVETHIFVTQLFHQFDLRTTMLVSRRFNSVFNIFVKTVYRQETSVHLETSLLILSDSASDKPTDIVSMLKRIQNCYGEILMLSSVELG